MKQFNLKKMVSMGLAALIAVNSFAETPEGLKICNPKEAREFIDSLVVSPKYRSLTERRRELIKAIHDGTDHPQFKDIIDAELVPEFETMRLFYRGARIDPKAQVRILFLHGNGASVSNSKAMRMGIRVFAEPHPETAGKTFRALMELPDYVHASAEAIDLPYHGVGPISPRFQDPIETRNWLYRYVKQMRAETPNIPIVVFTRSGSGGMATRVLENSTDAVDGFVLMSSTMPGNKEILNHAFNTARADAKVQGWAVREDLMSWAQHQLESTHWEPATFKGKPTLIATGSLDGQMTPPEREFYKKLAQTTPNLKYVDIPNAGHDILRFTGKDKDAGMQFFGEVYKVLNEAVKNTKH